MSTPKPKTVALIIVSDPERKFGQPTFYKTRLTLSFVIDALQSWSVAEFVREYPYMEMYRDVLVEIRGSVATSCRGKAKS